MSKDKLENFMLNHRDAFDEYEPDPALFQGVRTRKPEARIIQWNSLLWKAAAIAAIFIGSYFFHDWMGSTRQEQVAENVDQDQESTEIVKMLFEAEAYYAALINSRTEEFYHLTTQNKGLRQEINYELVELDSVYADLKNDLKDNAANQEVIEAMIQNYRIKLNILEDVLARLQSVNENKKQSKKHHEVEL